MKFLVIQQKMIGDVLTSTILCENLKTVFPDCRISFVACENTLPVLENNPFIDEVVVFKNEYRQNKLKFLAFLRQLRKQRFDAVIDAYGKLESNLISCFARAPKKVSYYKWYTKFLYSHTIQRHTTPDPKMPLSIKNRLELLKAIMPEQSFNCIQPKLYLTKEEKERISVLLRECNIGTGEKIIMLSVLGSSKNKTYPLEYMSFLIDYIGERTDAVFLFNYIPSQQDSAREVFMRCKKDTRKSIKLDLFGNSLRDFLGLVYHCNVLIGNEGGAVNMAKALNKPTFSIFNPVAKKEGWSVENDPKQVGVHLKDFREDIYSGKSKKQIKKEINSLYSAFKPELFTDALDNFLKKNL